MIVGIEKPTSGIITVDGKDITMLPMYKRAAEGIGYLPQEASIFRAMTVEENIRAMLETTTKTSDEIDTIVNSLIDEFNIGHVRERKGMQLSGGERRRVEIARCLALEPNFILLDEPFAGVDPIAVADIQQIILLSLWLHVFPSPNLPSTIMCVKHWALLIRRISLAVVRFFWKVLLKKLLMIQLLVNII